MIVIKDVHIPSSILAPITFDAPIISMHQSHCIPQPTNSHFFRVLHSLHVLESFQMSTKSEKGVFGIRKECSEGGSG